MRGKCTGIFLDTHALGVSLYLTVHFVPDRRMTAFPVDDLCSDLPAVTEYVWYFIGGSFGFCGGREVRFRQEDDIGVCGRDEVDCIV